MDLSLLVLFLALGATDHRARESASTALSRLPVHHIVDYLDAFARHPDPEISSRVHVLRVQHADALTVMVLQREAPWLDALAPSAERGDILCTWLGSPGSPALDRYRAGPYPMHSHATACYLRHCIAEGMTVGRRGGW